jgi:ribosomal protein S18 acetylase RimI-like enzyme
MGDIHIRFARANDLEICAAFDAGVPTDRLARKLAADEILLAETEGEVFGYLRLEYLWLKLPFIGLIHVAAQRRGAGVGRAMLEFLESHLRDRGHDVLLSSSRVDAHSAQQWHRRMGFEECGTLAGVNADGVGEMFFRKELRVES